MNQLLQLLYGLDRKSGLIAVFDGGEFDVSVLEVGDGVWVKSTNGIPFWEVIPTIDF